MIYEPLTREQRYGCSCKMGKDAAGCSRGAKMLEDARQIFENLVHFLNLRHLESLRLIQPAGGKLPAHRIKLSAHRF